MAAIFVDRKPGGKPGIPLLASRHHRQGQFCSVDPMQKYILESVDELCKTRQHLADATTKSVTGSPCYTSSESTATSERDVLEERDQILQTQSEHSATEHWQELLDIGTQFEGLECPGSADQQDAPGPFDIDHISKWLECWSRKKRASGGGFLAVEKDSTERYHIRGTRARNVKQ